MVQIVAIVVVGTRCEIEAFFRELQRAHRFIPLYVEQVEQISEHVRCEEQKLLFAEPIEDADLEEITWHHQSSVQVAACACT